MSLYKISVRFQTEGRQNVHFYKFCVFMIYFIEKVHDFLMSKQFSELLFDLLPFFNLFAKNWIKYFFLDLKKLCFFIQSSCPTYKKNIFIKYQILMIIILPTVAAQLSDTFRYFDAIIIIILIPGKLLRFHIFHLP